MKIVVHCLKGDNFAHSEGTEEAESSYDSEGKCKFSDMWTVWNAPCTRLNFCILHPIDCSSLEYLLYFFLKVAISIDFRL